MAKVYTQAKRQQSPHYGLYRAKSGGDEDTAIRRQIPLKQDYRHPASRKLSDQRDRLSLASKHWNILTTTEKLNWRRKLGFGYRSHSPQQETLLSGRALFISQDLYSLLSTGELLLLPFEVCIILCDEQHNPLLGQLFVYYQDTYLPYTPPEGYDLAILEAWDNSAIPYEPGWHLCPAREIQPGNWLVTDIPKNKQAYRVRGTAPFYVDPHIPASESMTEVQLKLYHYHVLIPALKLVIIELWDSEQPPFPFTRLILETWDAGQFPTELILSELWDEGEFPAEEYPILIYELWDEGEFPAQEYSILIFELWDEGEFPPNYYLIVIYELWDSGEFPPTTPPPWNPAYLAKLYEQWTS